MYRIITTPLIWALIAAMFFAVWWALYALTSAFHARWLETDVMAWPWPVQGLMGISAACAVLYAVAATRFHWI